MAIGTVILLHTLGSSQHFVGTLHFLHSLEGTIMIDEIEESVEHLKRTWSHAQCHVGMVDSQSAFAWNPLATVTGTLQLQGPCAVAEEKAHARSLDAVVEGKQIRGLGATPRKAITADALRVDVLAAAQIIHRATVVPEDLCLQTRAQQIIGGCQQSVLGGHTACEVSPRGINELLHLALSNRIDDEYGDAVAYHLDGCTRTIALAQQSMSTHFHTGRELLRLAANGQIEMGGDIMMRMTFEDDLFDHKAFALHRAHHAAMQVTPFGETAGELTHLLAHDCNVCLHVGLRSESLLQFLAALIVTLMLPKHQVVEPRLRAAELQRAIVRTAGISDKVIVCLGKEIRRKRTNCKA